MDRLKAKRVEIDARIPKHGDSFQESAAIGFSFKNVILEFGAWDRTPYETSVIVFNTDLRETIFFKDSLVETLDDVVSQLDELIDNLLSDKYSTMKRDPKLLNL